MDQELADQSSEIIELYKRHVPDYLVALGGAICAGDPEAISFQAHRLCSAMKSVGKMEIASLLECMQRPGVEPGDCETLFSQVEGRVNESLAKLAET